MGAGMGADMNAGMSADKSADMVAAMNTAACADEYTRAHKSSGVLPTADTINRAVSHRSGPNDEYVQDLR